jgi:hypothetical protein
MTNANSTDIKLDDDWQLTAAANGDAPVCSGLDCLFQSIKLEAVTQQGDLFYDPDFGWSLYDFAQSEDDELTRLELVQRAKAGLKKIEDILTETIVVSVEYSEDVFQLYCSFRFSGETADRDLNIVIGPVSVEVISID